RMGDRSEQDKLKYSWADAAFIAQNVYLFCASENLNTVVRGLVDREVLAEKLQLNDNHKIVLAQTVGYPVD
ncbi:MAG: nitroreductase family protein, partial [Bacteroidales bacterium]|nr:nitroreductase family protein [Bacteroidales bacterium]